MELLVKLDILALKILNYNLFLFLLYFYKYSFAEILQFLLSFNFANLMFYNIIIGK